MKLKAAAFTAIFAIAMLIAAGTALASPPCPEPFTVRQPTGEEITVTQHGDEWFHWAEAQDGSVIVKGSDEYWRYAEYSSGKLSPMPARYGIDPMPDGALTDDALLQAIALDPPESAKAAIARNTAIKKAGGIPAPKGPQPLLVILVSFKDRPISGTSFYGGQTASAYWYGKMYNDYSAYSTKTSSFSSVNDYYREVSNNTFYFTPAVTTGTPNKGIISVTLPVNHPSFNDVETDSVYVAQQALQLANANINFAAYAGADGIVSSNELHIVFIVAGYEASYGEVPYDNLQTWAHYMWGVSPLRLDNVYVGDNYVELGEIHGDTVFDHPATIGALTHELGHSLGLPDLYDTQQTSTGYDSLGVGVYSLMGAGEWGYVTSFPGSSPTHLDAWCKSLLGFVNPLTCTSGNHQLNSAAPGYNILKLPTTDPKQYFLIENRQFTGYDQSLKRYCASGGIAIWHIDENVLDDHPYWQYVNDDQKHKAVDLEEANEGIAGKSQLDNNIYPWQVAGGYDHLFRRGSPTKCNSTFTGATSPSSNLYDGSASGVSVDVDSPSGSSMTVLIGLELNSLLTNRTSPVHEDRKIHFLCGASGARNITYMFEVFQNGARIGGMDSYSYVSSYDWTPTGPGTGYTVKVSALADGVTTPVTKESSVFEIQADDTLPVITAASGGAPVSAGGYAKANVQLSLADADADDAVSGTYRKDGGEPVTFSPSGITLTDEGAYTVSATDLAGNASSLSFTIDKTPPAIAASAGSAGIAFGQAVTQDVTVSVTASDLSGNTAAKDGSDYPWPSGGVFTEDGSYEITAKDLAQNISTFRFSILPDGSILAAQALPGWQLLNDGDAVSQNVTATVLDPAWTASVIRNGAPYAVNWANGSCTLALEGRYAVTAANGSESVTMSFAIDRGIPAITAKNASKKKISQGSVNKTAITVSASDGTNMAFSATRNGVQYDWPASGRFTADGVYVATATDAAGNASSFRFTIDLYTPAISAMKDGGAALASKGYSSVPVTVSVSDTTLYKYYAKRDGHTISWPTGGRFASEGDYYIYARDRLGRVRTFTFTIDWTAPVLRGKYGSTAVAEGGIFRYVTLYITEKHLAGKSAVKNGVLIRWPGSTFRSSGSYTVTVTDKAGNSKSFSFIVDATKPVIAVTNLSGTPVRSYRTAYGGAIITVTDTYFKSKTVKLGKTYIVWPEDDTFTAKGTYYITAYDIAGNKVTYTFYVK